MNHPENSTMESKTWADYDSAYRQVLGDPSFLSWRAVGAQQRARNIMPMVKKALKTVIPGWLYPWLLTTHATFLCRGHARGANNAKLAEGASKSETS
jgi:hypothetical protein